MTEFIPVTADDLEQLRNAVVLGRQIYVSVQALHAFAKIDKAEAIGLIDELPELSLDKHIDASAIEYVVDENNDVWISAATDD